MQENNHEQGAQVPINRADVAIALTEFTQNITTAVNNMSLRLEHIISRQAINVLQTIQGPIIASINNIGVVIEAEVNATMVRVHTAVAENINHTTENTTRAIQEAMRNINDVVRSSVRLEGEVGLDAEENPERLPPWGMRVGRGHNPIGNSVE